MTNLRRKRLENGLSRKELAIQSGIKLRTIESYEQRLRNINKVKIETLIKLSKALNCEIKDIIEK